MTYVERWTIKTDEERASEESVLAAFFDDIYIYICNIYVFEIMSTQRVRNMSIRVKIVLYPE